jgi:hypothetical protein
LTDSVPVFHRPEIARRFAQQVLGRGAGTAVPSGCSSAHHGLRVVCTGSNRDKLAMLRNSKDQAFFGAPMVNFPLLAKDYVEWFCDQADMAFDLDPEQVWPLFIEAGHRPELLGSAADVLRAEGWLDDL